jgi:integrase
VLWQKLKEIAPDDDSPIFGTPNKCDYHYWRGRLLNSLTALKLPRMKFSDFRKHRASQLIDAGCSKAAYSQLMGHSPVVALRHYAMATDSELQQAAMLVPTPLYFREADTSD